MIDLKYVYAINSSVDVYKIGDDILEFYFISSRRRVTLKVTLSVINVLQSFDALLTIEEICVLNKITPDDNVLDFLNYLLKENILYCLTTLNQDKNILSTTDIDRYDRQLNYFDTVYNLKSYDLQKRIQDEVILILGVGAIGSGIATQLVMSGARNLVIVDKDIITSDSLQRHYSYKQSDIGRPKVHALKDYLTAIDSKLKCDTFFETVNFDTSLELWLDKSTFVINTLDEPYIGITSLMVGRVCYEKKIPLYIAGGFDAHLMSTGELIIPGITPCVDCYTSYFSESLNDWHPQYNLQALSDEAVANNRFEVGGLASMSLFSVSYAIIIIINYFAGNNLNIIGRGELLFDKLDINYLNISKNPNCIICGSK